jgi:hypothetical protein
VTPPETDQAPDIIFAPGIGAWVREVAPRYVLCLTREAAVTVPAGIQPLGALAVTFEPTTEGRATLAQALGVDETFIRCVKDLLDAGTRFHGFGKLAIQKLPSSVALIWAMQEAPRNAHVLVGPQLGFESIVATRMSYACLIGRLTRVEGDERCRDEALTRLVGANCMAITDGPADPSPLSMETMLAMAGLRVVRV